MSEFARRRQTLAARLRSLPSAQPDGPPVSVDALLVSGLASVRYLTGFTGSNGLLLLFPSSHAVFYTDPRYSLQSKTEVDCPVKIAKGQMLAAVAKTAQKAGLRRLGFEAERLGYHSYAFLQSKLTASVALEPLRGVVEEQRMCKSPEEIARIRRSVETNSEAFRRALAHIRPGRTREFDLAAEIDYRMRRLGAEKTAFETIVVGGTRTAFPHARPSAAILEPDELLLIDMGATQDGYASDMTRMLFLGRAGQRVKSVYRAVLDAQLAAIAAVRPGVTAGHVDRVARRVLRAHGLEKSFVHSTGHGLGLEIHEPPRLGRKEKTRLREGMTITIEPGAYLEGLGGVRIEDTVLVTSNGCEILTPTPKELLEI
ncbi:MAG: aminopeptidase P family protein [Acidobacteria bacterium]|nr:aminopeptidase P family protein [Acidobacteriota bacterium]MBI3472571.1 aminopeptidase P family protein [Candidatus Solibacter usitatus]